MTSGSLGVSSGFQASGSTPPQGNASVSTLNDTSISQAKGVQYLYEFGTTTGTINTLIVQERTIAASSSTTLNLFDGSLIDILGATGGLQTVRFVQISIIKNPGTSVYASSVTIGNAASNRQQLWFSTSTSTQTIDYAVPFTQGDRTGKTVDASNCNLLIANDDAVNAATVRICIGGRHV